MGLEQLLLRLICAVADQPRILSPAQVIDGAPATGSSIRQAPLPLEPDPDCPNLLRFERVLGASFRPAYHGRSFLKTGS
jgi:hypothetical protein